MDFLIVIGPALVAGLFSIFGSVIGWSLNRREAAHKITKEVTEQVGINQRTLKELNERVEQLDKLSLTTREGIKSILRYMLQRYHGEYMLHGHLSSHQKAEFLETYEVYRTLGGNGTATGWKEDICKLPVRDDLPAVNPYLEILKGDDETQ